ncbi:hypothetical protein BSKO_11783 [Bryopsis sp. KO-2023]|nr:hypothetical protein BSKO_11783 [Bryopsis sp. KO-2023]
MFVSLSRNSVPRPQTILTSLLGGRSDVSCWFSQSALPDGSINSTGSLLVAHPRSKSPANLAEALRLAKTYTGVECPHTLVGPSNRFDPHPSTFFGSGTLQSLAAQCQDIDCRELFVNSDLTKVQYRNVGRMVQVPVLDRMGLIISIFAQRAKTREAKLQVQLAALEYESTRLVRIVDEFGQRVGFGEGGSMEVVSARQRGRGGSEGGGMGGGGAGEKEINLQRHRIGEKRKKLKRQLEQVRKTRAVQRQGRLKGNVPMVAVVGYTNAGKSTLVSRLTKKDLEQDDLLFKTLDPALRRLVLPSGKFAVLSDTVGFISELPVQLVDAFHATLEEVIHADVLVHVIDASDANAKSQRDSTIKVLGELGISRKDMAERTIEVWNKADSLPYTSPSTAPVCLQQSSPMISLPPNSEEIIVRPTPQIPKFLVSAKTGDGLSDFRQALDDRLGNLYKQKRWAPPWVHREEEI